MADPDYAERFRATEQKSARTLEDEAVRRAHEGLRKAVRYKGRIVGYETEYSDTLLLALLKKTNPEGFRDRATIAHTDPTGKPLFPLEAIEKYLQSRKNSDADYDKLP